MRENIFKLYIPYFLFIKKLVIFYKKQTNLVHKKIVIGFKNYI